MSFLINPFRFAAGGGAPGAGAHRYWRLLIDSSQNGSSAVGISEIEMRATSGGADLCSGGTASASSEAAGSTAAENAFSNDGTSSRWQAGSATNEWIKYDFGSAVEVNYISMLGALNRDNSPAACRVQYSDDDSSWTTTIEIGDAYTLFAEATEYPQAAESSNLWRILFADSIHGTALRAGNIQFRDGAGGTDLFAGATNSATTNVAAGNVMTSGASSSDGDEAFSASNTDYWTKSGSFPAWIQVASGAAVTVEEIAFSTPDINVSFIYPPKNMSLQYYDQGAGSWTTKFTFAEETGWARNETRVLVEA